jgi:hypothetical protein
MDGNNLGGVLLALLVFLGIVFYVEQMDDVKISRIKKYKKFVTAEITRKRSTGYRGSYLNLTVAYSWGNKVLTADFSAPDTECNVIGKKVVLITDSTNPDNVKLLLRATDFSEFELIFPDSLEWAEECFKL